MDCCGRVDCDVLGKDVDPGNCDFDSFFAGKSAVVVYDRQNLEEISPYRLKRQNPRNPSEHVKVVIVPEVRQSAYLPA